MSEANALLEIFAAVVLGMILLSCVFEKRQSKQHRIFVAMLTANFAAMVTEAMVIVFKGTTGMDSLLAMITFASCMCGYVLAFFYAAYVHACINLQHAIPATPVKTALILLGVCMVCTAAGWYWEVLYYVRDGLYYMTPYYPFALLYDIVGVSIAVYLLIRYRKAISATDFIALLSFPVMVIAALVLQYVVWRKTSQIFVLTMLSLMIIYLMIQKDRVRKTKQQKKELEEMRMQLMLSQIQPHFIFNSLSCVRRLITKDQEEAVAALEKFSLYLRKNLDSMNSSQAVPFLHELEHTKEYLYLERLRFGERIQVHYQIECDHFALPVLTVQPIVENAVKHGVLEKAEGGTIWISAWETADAFQIRVADDGVGFDPLTETANGKSHVGIANVRYRLQAQCNGTLQIESKPGAGTSVTIQIPKTSEE